MRNLAKIKLDKRQRSLLTAFLAAVILLELVWAYNYSSKPTPTVPTPSASGGPEASLALSPSEGTFAVGKNFEVQVVLEAEDNVATDGVDIILTFDPTLLEVLDVSSLDFYPQRLVNEVDNEKGIIRLAAANTPKQDEVKGGGVIATITFKTLKAGEAEVAFGDSTIAGTGGSNILSQVTNGRYVIH